MLKKIVLIFIAFFPFQSFAQLDTVEMSGGGKFDLTKVTTEDESYTVAIFDQVLVVNKSEHKLFNVKDIFVTHECIGYAKSINKLTKLEGSCIFKDFNGDSWQGTFSREGNAGESGTGGTWNVKGLQGKYADLRGTCSYVIKYIRNEELYGVDFVKCSFEK